MPAPAEPKNTVAFAGTLPADPANGLLPLVDELIAHPGIRRCAVVEFYAMKRTSVTDDGTWQAVVRFSQIEPVDGDDAEAAQAIMQRVQTQRLGQLDLSGAEE